jgi:PAS domain S-box-containing protein
MSRRRSPIRFRSSLVIAGLGLSFGVLSFVVTYWHEALGLEEGSVGLALLAGVAAVVLTIVGALLLRWAARPVEQALRDSAEEARQARENLEALIESAPLAMITIDTEGRVTDHWNPAAERLFGWRREEVVGRPLPIVPAEKQEEFAELRRRALAGEPVLNVAIRRVRQGGTPVDLSLSTAVVHRPGGKDREILAIASDITSDVAVRHQLEFQAAIIGNIGDPVIAYDLRNRVTYWNDAAAGLYGWTAAEMLGTYANERLQMEPVEGSLHDIKARLDRDGYYQGEFRIRCRDGRQVQVESRCTQLLEVAGQIRGYVSISRDLTERRAMEARLRESEARFRRLLENAPDIIYRYRVRPDRGFEYLSPAVEAISGYTLEEFYADPDIALRLVPAEAHGVIHTLGQRPEELAGQTVLLPWRRKDGGRVWVEHRNVLVRDDAGEVVAFEGVARDVTGRKEIEERYARLSEVVEQSAELVLVTDTSGTIVYVNPAFERMTGYSAEEAIGRNPRMLKSGLQAAEFYRDLWSALLRGESWAGRLRNRRKDGSLYTADAVISPVRDRTGAIVNYVGLQRDMTRESELDEQLRQAQKMEAVGQLTGGIAHDFNNLLTVILANLSLLQEELKEAPGAVPHYLRDVQNAALRGSEMVRKLLAFGRQERLQPRPLDLRHLLLEFIRTVGRMLPEAIEFDVTAADDLPPAQADPGAVEQILLNLATNARDAMPQGGEVHIRLGLATFASQGERSVSGWHEPGTFVHLAFRDTGGGMEQATLERIFDPFFTTKSAGKGSGLGMPMVYGLMKQHHGFVTVESAPGQGTTVHLYFPVAREALASSEPAGRAGSLPRGTETILLVEDEEPIRRVAERILGQLGYTVRVAEDGVAALALFRQAPGAVDLILTDVVMPRLNGPDLVAALRKEGHPVPVVFATGYASSQILADHGSLKHARFIEKPWTVETLAWRVREALDGHGR